MWVAHKYGLVFNPQKTHVKASTVNFFGCLYDANGVHPDPDKVDAIHTLPAPTNVTKLQEFLGMVKYLSPFIPGLSTLTAPLHELLKKDTNFTWNCTYDAAFQCVKDAIINDTTLRYFDPSLPMTIPVDASQVGLGAVLLQNNKPIAFASKASLKQNAIMPTLKERCSLSSSELRDSELMSMVDPLPLNQTTSPWNPSPRKNLADMPAWLQHILLCLQGYDYIIHYHPSKEMALPNMLSYFSPCPGPNIPVDIAIHHAHLSPEQKEAFQQAFMNDPEMCTLANIIITSWPDDIKAFPPLTSILATSLMKIALSSMEKPSLFPLWKGREYYINCTSSIKESPEPSCLCMDASSGLV